jgi:hypothetical protein
VKRTVLGMLLALVSLSQPLARAAGSKESPDPDVANTERTIVAMRDVGASIFAWLTDNYTEPPPGVTPQRIAKVESVDWTQCPRISHSQLTVLLVPQYIHEVPSLDGWGHPLEFCLNRANLFTGTYLVGVRSSGRDGQFEDTPFPPGAFDPRDYDRDVVWLDAFFVAWPQGSEPLHRRELPALPADTH